LAEKEISIEIKNPEILLLVGFLIVALTLMLMITFPSPIVFGDEGYHTVMAQRIASGQEYFVWQPIESGKLMKHGFVRPPLWNFLEASFFFLFGFSEVIVKFLTPFIATILIGVATYVLVKRIFNKNVALIAAIMILYIPSLVTYSILFTTDILLVFYMLLFIFTFVLALQAGSKKYFMLSGIFGGLAMLTKTSAFAIFPIIILAFLYMAYKDRNYKHLLKQFLILGVFFAIVYGTFFIRNLALFNMTGTGFFSFITKPKTIITFSYTPKFNVAAAAPLSDTGLNILNYGITNYISFAYGSPWFVPLAFLAGSIILLMRRSKVDIFLVIVLLSYLPVLYQTAFGGRSEDASRYALVVLPAIVTIAAVYFDAIYDFIKQYYKKLALVVFLLIIVLSLLGLYTKLYSMKGVKQFSSLFLDACDFIKHNTTSNALLLTIWDHQTVYNCQRDALSPNGLPDQGDIMLSNDVNISIPRLKAHGITHVFIQKFSISSGTEQDRYPISFINFMNDNPKSFKKTFENGASVNTCSQQDGCAGNIVYQVV